MLLDDLRQDLKEGHKRPIILLGERLQGGLDPFAPPVQAAAYDLLGRLADACAAYDLTPLKQHFLQELGDTDKPGYRFVERCTVALPPYPVTAFEVSLVSSGSALVFMQCERISDRVRVNNYFLKDAALARPRRSTTERPAVRVIPADDLNAHGDAELEAEFYVTLSLFMRNEAQSVLFTDYICYFTDRQGAPLTTPMTRADLVGLAQQELAYSKGHQVSRDMLLARQLSELESTAAYTFMRTGLILAVPCWYALDLLQCANVDTAERPIPERLQASRIQKGKSPLTTYKTLFVTVPKSKRKARNAGFTAQDLEPGTVRRMPFHMVSGVLADYTQKGLFGKYKGRFWKPAHVKGTKDAGEVIKGYALTTQGAPKVQRPSLSQERQREILLTAVYGDNEKQKA